MANLTLGERVRQRREEMGKSQEWVAEQAGTSQATIDKIENNRSVRSRFLPAIFGVLKMPLEELAGGPVSAPGPIPNQQLVAGRDLPVYASAEGGEGQIILHTDPVDYVRRPAPLLHVRDGYGLIITGTSMEPAFRPGDVALVHPRIPPRVEDGVVLYSGEESGGERKATIKEYRGANDDVWRLRRYQPNQKDFQLDKGEWPIIHTVVGKYSRR